MVGGAGFDRQQAEAVRIAEDRAARLRLPHVIDDRDAAAEDLVLQPVPRRRVEHFARAEHALEPRVVDAQKRSVAVAHQRAHGRGRGEDAGAAELLDDRSPVRVGLRKVERALEDDARAAGEQRTVDDVAVADDPADVGGRPPDVRRPQREHPAAHAVDVHLVPAVRVHRQLRPRGRARRREDEGRLVRLHGRPVARLSAAARQEIGPADVARLSRSGLQRPIEDDDVLDRRAAGHEGIVDDLLQADVLALAVRRVGREHEARAARRDAIRERLRAKAGEHHRVDGADPDGGEHQHDRFDRRRHVDRDPVALADAHPAQRGRRPLDLVPELRIGEHTPFAALVQVDERRASAVARLDVSIDRVVREVGLCADEPLEGGRRPVEDLVPGPEPRKRLRRFLPERVRIAPRVLNPAIDDGIDECHGVYVLVKSA